jgi:catechol 2,3-dioxygenase-like lactoylglutathione lyase family enzyme
MSPRPSHVGLCVSDLERSMRFYCDGLGFERSDGYDLDSSVVAGLDAALEVPGPAVLRSQMIVLDGLRLELLHYTSPAVEGRPSSHRNQLGLTHLSFWVDDLEATADRLVECGGTLMADTRQSPGVELVFLADPDGTRVELMEQPT